MLAPASPHSGLAKGHAQSSLALLQATPTLPLGHHSKETEPALLCSPQLLCCSQIPYTAQSHLEGSWGKLMRGKGVVLVIPF